MLEVGRGSQMGRVLVCFSRRERKMKICTTLAADQTAKGVYGVMVGHSNDTFRPTWFYLW